MSEKKRFLFIHGGPGMNSFAEEAVLGKSLSERGYESTFWNEPSKSRPDGDPFDPENAYNGLTQSAAKQINMLRQGDDRLHLVCLSFGVHPVFSALSENSSGIESLTIISPMFHFKKEIWNIIGFAEKDFKSSAPDKSQTIRKLREESKEFFDTQMQQALGIGAEDEALFTNYWRNKAAMEQYFGAWFKRSTGLDLESFFAVMGQFSVTKESFSNVTFDIPTRVILGAHDQTIDSQPELETCKKIFRDLSVHDFEESAHYPHLEESDRFLKLFL